MSRLILIIPLTIVLSGCFATGATVVSALAGVGSSYFSYKSLTKPTYTAECAFVGPIYIEDASSLTREEKLKLVALNKGVAKFCEGAE